MSEPGEVASHPLNGDSRAPEPEEDGRDGRRMQAVVGLALAGVWIGGVLTSSGVEEWPVRCALAVGVLPLIVLSSIAWQRVALSAWNQNLLALSAPLTLLWALNYPALTSWWIRDDPCHLVNILDHGLWRPFLHSIGHFLTPWLNLSLGADLVLFGLQPQAFYAHQLLSFSALIVVGYGFLRAYLSPAGAGLAMCLFVVSVPSLAIARLLMNRHYLEGLILVLVAFALYRRSIAAQRFSWAILGAAFYLLSTATKEVFVPLVFLLPFLVRGDGWRRGWHSLPFLIAAGFYGLWRLQMLGFGNSLTAYGALGGEFRPEALGYVASMMGWGKGWQVGFAIVATLIMAFGLRRVPRAWLALGVGFIALAAPLLPVIARLEPRHFFLPAFVLAALLANALDPQGSRTQRHSSFLTLASILFLLWALRSLTGSHFWQHFEPTIAHHRAEGQFVLRDPRDGLLMTSVNHSTFLQCLARLRREVLGREGEAGFCGDACYCAERFPHQQRWRYQKGTRGGEEVSAVSAVANVGCSDDRLVEVELLHDQGAHQMSWAFGPDLDGAYEVLLISGTDEAPEVSIPVALPREGVIPYWLFEPLHFVVKHRSPEGQLTYSRIYRVEPGGQAVAVP